MAKIQELFKELYGDEAERRTQAIITDDDPLVANAISRFLKGPNTGIATTIKFSSPADAIDALERKTACDSVALVVTDLNMPGGMDGIQFAGHVRRVIRETRIPILLCSGGITDATLQAILAAIDSGAVDAFLKKPFEPEKLFDAVERAIEGRLELVKMSQGGGGQEGTMVSEQGFATSAEQVGIDGSGREDTTKVPGQENETPQK